MEDIEQMTKWAVKDIRKRGINKLNSFYIYASNGYDGIRIKKNSVKVIDAKKGIIQMQIIGIDGA